MRPVGPLAPRLGLGKPGTGFASLVRRTSPSTSPMGWAVTRVGVACMTGCVAGMTGTLGGWGSGRRCRCLGARCSCCTCTTPGPPPRPRDARSHGCARSVPVVAALRYPVRRSRPGPRTLCRAWPVGWKTWSVGWPTRGPWTLSSRSRIGHRDGWAQIHCSIQLEDRPSSLRASEGLHQAQTRNDFFTTRMEEHYLK